MGPISGTSTKAEAALLCPREEGGDVEKLQHHGCISREDGGLWRSGYFSNRDSANHHPFSMTVSTNWPTNRLRLVTTPWGVAGPHHDEVLNIKK
jgi:hypothetical protein